MSTLIEALGTKRVLEPPGALPQAAVRLDVTLPLQRYEVELAVDMLAVDSTSFRQLADTNGSDPARIGEAIRRIASERGKLHNPVTGSGGILTGTVAAVGEEYPDPPPIGTRVISLASLTLTPLQLSSVGDLEPRNPHVPVRGTAFLPWTAPLAIFPDDIGLDAALAALDVCNAASQTRALIDEHTRTMLVLGGGHGGLLALAAGRDCLRPDSRLVLIDAEQRICERARELELCDVALCVDLRDAVGALEALDRAGVARADLTVVVVNASDCEAAALLLTGGRGTILFFSMATSFTQAALGSEGMASTARMMIGSGYIPDRGDYALELVRRNRRLERALDG